MERIPRQRSLPLKLATTFRLLLWWGAETAREWMVKGPKPEIRQVRHELTLYPDSYWTWSGERCSFMAFSDADRQIYVRYLNDFGNN